MEIRAAWKFIRHRQGWAEKDYQKVNLGSQWKSNLFASHAKAIISKKVDVEAKQPNSAIRKCVRVQLIKNGKKFTAYVPQKVCLNYLENNEILVAGFSRNGDAVFYMPGVCFKLVKLAYVSLLDLYKEQEERHRS